MKNLTLLAFVVLYAAPTFASDKICFWTGGNEGLRGDKLFAKISAKKVTISGTESWDGTYPREMPNLTGRDGRTYYSYDAGSNDGANSVLLEKDLLKNGTKGNLKIRGRGEGFFEQKYFCRDQE